MSFKRCALSTSSGKVFLDHISPLASLLKMPLIVAEEETALLTQTYYPEVEVHYWPDLKLRLNEVVEQFDTLFECTYWTSCTQALLRRACSKNIQFVYCPHGQSDKGYRYPSLAPYAWQEAILLYGSLMREMLQELKIWDDIPKKAEVGNFRLAYFKQHEARLCQIAEKEIFSRLNPANRTLFYAPTWNDYDAATSFFAHGEALFRNLPKDWNLIVKVHPLLPHKDPAFFYRFSYFEEKCPNFILVSDFPLIYPLLQKMDAYLGDYSSVGYDALSFQKPMFFFSQAGLPPARLHSCGERVDTVAHLFQTMDRRIDRASTFRPAQEQLYQRAFSAQASLHEAVATFV